MTVCDICGYQSMYEHYVYTSETSGKNVDLCGICCNKLLEKEKKYKYLAYKETVEEIKKLKEKFGT